MQGTQPRTLSNKELIRFCADLLEHGHLPDNFVVEILRRLNYYTDGLGDQTASQKDPRQLDLPL